MESSGYTLDSRKRAPELKSWGERQIALLLERSGIDYFYEHPLAVVDEGKVRIWYPDFQLPHYGMLIEYFGMIDDPAYATGVERKKAVYEANGLTALLLTPEAFRGDWPSKILDRIEGVLVGRVRRLRGTQKAYGSQSGSPNGYGQQ